MIYIKSNLEGYCRCRTIFGKKSQKFSDDHFTPQQLFGLRRDPILRVTTRKDELVAKPAAKTPKGAKD